MRLILIVYMDELGEGPINAKRSGGAAARERPYACCNSVNLVLGGRQDLA